MARVVDLSAPGEALRVQDRALEGLEKALETLGLAVVAYVWGIPGLAPPDSEPSPNPLFLGCRFFWGTPLALAQAGGYLGSTLAVFGVTSRLGLDAAGAGGTLSMVLAAFWGVPRLHTAADRMFPGIPGPAPARSEETSALSFLLHSTPSP